MQDFFQEMSEKDEKMKSLVNMGFPEDEAKMAIDRCGLDAPVAVLVDSIYASQEAGNGYSANLSDYEVPCDYNASESIGCFISLNITALASSL